jgi:hypothetical protein
MSLVGKIILVAGGSGIVGSGISRVLIGQGLQKYVNKSNLNKELT